jgi:hypothetical protein
MCKAHIISHVCCSEYNTHVQSEWKSLCTSLNMDTGKSEKKFEYTRCDNLIPGMALRKQSLLTCALAAAVAFEILSL